MTEFMNFDRNDPSEGSGGEAPENRRRPGGREPARDGESPPEPKEKSAGAGGDAEGQSRSFRGDRDAEPDFIDCSLNPFMIRSTQHPMRAPLRSLRQELSAFLELSNREAGMIGFRTDGPPPVLITALRRAVRDTAQEVESHVDYLGDRSVRSLRGRILGHAVLTDLKQFDIYLTQSNFRGGVVPPGELSVVLNAVNQLAGALGQRIVQLDSLYAAEPSGLEIDADEAE